VNRPLLRGHQHEALRPDHKRAPAVGWWIGPLTHSHGRHIGLPTRSAVRRWSERRPLGPATLASQLTPHQWSRLGIDNARPLATINRPHVNHVRFPSDLHDATEPMRCPPDRNIRCAKHLMPAGSSPSRPDRPGGMYPLQVAVTMSMHKLTAGSGYDYLTRQVAALDATEKGHTGLAS
jgi:hypothetical protein